MATTATAPAKKRGRPAKSAAPEINSGAAQTAPDYQLIRRDLLQPSPTNPRKRFPQASIDELAGSIRDKGIIEPLIVRSWSAKPKATKNGTDYDKTYEIVCGERRFRAATQAELAELPCIVRALTDDEVLDIQIHENLHREDVHPIDEALGYKFLQERLGCTTVELAARVGQTEHYVVNRLKLNELIDKAQKDMEDGRLPIAHALEMVKFPAETQELIYEDMLWDGEWEDQDPKTKKWIPMQPVPLKQLCKEINSSLLHQLTKAPFDVKATNLRADGLACVACPERTGAVPGLFAAYDLKKTDNCLNEKCYEAKEQQRLVNARDAVATALGVKSDQVKYYKPDVSRDWNGVFLGSSDAQVVGERAKGKAGDSVFDGVIIADGKQFGKHVLLKPHPKQSSGSFSSSSSGRSSSSSTSGEKSPEEKAQFYKRKEEIWNVNVAETTRKRIFALAAGKFAEQFDVTGGGDTFTAALCATLEHAMSYSGSYEQRPVPGMAKGIVADHLDMTTDALESHTYDEAGNGDEKVLAKLPEDAQKRLLFILIHGHKGATSGYWKSQDAVHELAEKWSVDYKLIDAKVRAELSSKKYQQLHDDYLKNIELGDGKANPPRLYSEDWTPVNRY